MPFQDIDDSVLVETPRRPSAVERWARRIFIQDWSLKLVAIAITLVLWMAVTSQNKPETIRTGARLNFIRPPDLDISNDPPKGVDVFLTGSRSKLSNISTPDLVATVDLTDHRTGDRVVRLSLDRVKMTLPPGVVIESFQPSTIPIRLEPRVARQLEIEVKLEGKVAEGYEVYDVKPTQPTVKVRGPASRIELLQSAPTEAISIDGKKETFTASRVAIDIPDQKIDLLDENVDVLVEIGERSAEKSFSGVPALSNTGAGINPRTASVILSGPSSLINQLQREEVKVVVDVSNSGASVARLDLPPSFKNRIKVLSIKPAKFSVNK